MNTDKIHAELLQTNMHSRTPIMLSHFASWMGKAKLPATVFTYTFGIIALRW